MEKKAEHANIKRHFVTFISSGPIEERVRQLDVEKRGAVSN